MEKITFDSEKHIYYCEGLKVPGVTKVLQGAGLIDFSMVKPDILERAQNFGTAVHLATEFDDNGVLDMASLDDALLPYVEAWRKFKRDTGCKILSIEEVVYSAKYRYCGTLDRRMLIKERHTVVDPKSGVGFHPASAIQLEAYKEAWNEGKPVKDKIKDRLVVLLCGDGTYKLPVDDYYQKTDFSVFLAALTLRNWKVRHKL